MKYNLHTHTTWCDGRDSPRAVAEAAVEKGFDILGFSSHAMLPGRYLEWALTPEKAPRYAAEIRALAAEFAPKLKILCGVEADWLAGEAEPSREAYSCISPDYIIGSVHFVRGAGGAIVCVDKSPQSMEDGIRDGFGGDVGKFVSAYFAAVRESLAFDFDIVGHPDLVRKFNAGGRYFDESADWYVKELERTADAVAASGKLVEVNTGAISRGWLDDAYPSPAFRAMLRERGVGFVLSADAHAADTIDCAFDRFGECEEFRVPGFVGRRSEFMV